MPIDPNRPFIPLQIAVLTISDTRTVETDKSGAVLVEFVEGAGHRLARRAIVEDDRHRIATTLREWCALDDVQVVLTTGGTGITRRDVTPEAVQDVADKIIDGFGELFRLQSYDKIGTSTVQSRAMAATCNRKLIFALPGSPSACRDAWEGILSTQLDARHRPCNFAELLERL